MMTEALILTIFLTKIQYSPFSTPRNHKLPRMKNDYNE